MDNCQLLLVAIGAIAAVVGIALLFRPLNPPTTNGTRTDCMALEVVRKMVQKQLGKEMEGRDIYFTQFRIWVDETHDGPLWGPYYYFYKKIRDVKVWAHFSVEGHGKCGGPSFVEAKVRFVTSASRKRDLKSTEFQGPDMISGEIRNFRAWCYGPDPKPIAFAEELTWGWEKRWEEYDLPGGPILRERRVLQYPEVLAHGQKLWEEGPHSYSISPFHPEKERRK